MTLTKEEMQKYIGKLVIITFSNKAKRYGFVKSIKDDCLYADFVIQMIDKRTKSFNNTSILSSDTPFDFESINEASKKDYHELLFVVFNYLRK